MQLSKDMKYEDFKKEYAQYDKYVKGNSAEVAKIADVSLDVWRNVFAGKTKTPKTLSKIILACRQFVVDGAKAVPRVKVMIEAA